jgi:Ca2+-binding EF-hand superfamily protein
LFDWFDRDGDGLLTREEVSRIFPLPLPGPKVLRIDFDKLDADGDGKASRAELKEYCRNHGFSPMVVIVEPPSIENARLVELFRRCLNGDGKLTREKLRRAPDLLRRYDLNEDGFLQLSELIAAAKKGAKKEDAAPFQGKRAASSVRTGIPPDALLDVNVGGKLEPAPRRNPPAKTRRFVATSQRAGLYWLYDPDYLWLMSWRTSFDVPDVAAAGEFLVAQFKDSLGTRPWLAKSILEQNAGLSGLAELFPYADRNGDGHLTLVELEDYFRLVEAGVKAQVWIQVKDHDRNPFPLLDSDGDGLWSYLELSQAPHLLPPALAAANDLPRQFRLVFGGPPVKSWGGVQLPAGARPRRPRGKAGSQAPPWFQALDRNGDGVISPEEACHFPGHTRSRG